MSKPKQTIIHVLRIFQRSSTQSFCANAILMWTSQNALHTSFSCFAQFFFSSLCLHLPCLNYTDYFRNISFNCLHVFSLTLLLSFVKATNSLSKIASKHLNSQVEGNMFPFFYLQTKQPTLYLKQAIFSLVVWYSTLIFFLQQFP